MPPRKRKADAAAADADGGDGGDHSPTPKKSKKEQLAEARARAKAWHDQRHGKSPAPAAKAAAFSPGKSPAAERTPSKAGGSAAKRKRTAGRRSTGAIAASGSSRTPGSSSGAKVKQEARKGRRSAGAAASFEFQPPAEEEEGEDEMEDSEEEEPRTFEFGSATKRPADSDDDEDEMEVEEEEEKKPSAAKRKREEGKAKIAALRESRMSQGKAVTGGQKSYNRPGIHGNQKYGAGRPLGYASPDPPSAAATGAAAREVEEGAKLKSPDPPAAAAAAASMPPAAASAALARKPAARPTKPPASVAALFAQPKRANAAHRPGKAKFDPTNPFPSTGYKLPTAAYCGCGPTPGSSTSSALQSGGGAKECWRGERRISVDIDTVAGGVAAQRGSWTARERMRSLSQVSYTGTEGETSVRPEPPGRTGADGTKEDGTGTASAAPPNDPALGSAISRVKGLLGMAASANNDRRAAMGIRSAQVQQGATTTAEGMPPRTEPAAEERKDPPPGGNSHPTSCQATLQRFREAGGAKRPQEARAPAAPEGSATVAGQHTAETGENGVIREEETPVEPAKPSALWRGTVAVFKFIMLAQMAGGMLWLATTYGSSVFQDIGQASEKVAESIEERLEERFACFLDYPTHEGDEDVEPGILEGCVGKYKQCPPWGRCHAGKLRDCDDAGGVFDGLHRFVPDKHGNACVPSPEATEVMGAVQDALVDLTVAQNCRSSDRVRDASAVSLVEPFPLFRLEEVAKRVPHPRMAEADGAHRGFLLWISPAFDEDLVRFGALSGDDGDDVDAMSLGAGVSPNSLPLPLSCTLKMMSWELLGYLAAFSMTMAAFSFQNGWYLITHYPLYVSVAVVLLYLIAVVRRKRKHRAKVKELVGVVREATYDRLAECEDHEGYAALHLRDDIARERYPNSWKDRAFLNEHVWPVIILEVRSDNRVRKFRKMSHGKDLEHWDFAIQSKRSRRQRRSLGSTPASTPAGGNVVETEEKMGQKRDP